MNAKWTAEDDARRVTLRLPAALLRAARIAAAHADLSVNEWVNVTLQRAVGELREGER